MKDCLFCKIVKGEIPSTKVFEDENVFGFKDLYPQAKCHYVFVHKKHSTNAVEMSLSDPLQVQDLFVAMAHFSKMDSSQLSQGHRIVTNVGKNAGQTIFHTHFHVLGGEALGRFGA